MCNHAEIGRSALNGVGINTGEPQNGEHWNSALLRWEAWLTPKYTPHVLHVKFTSSATKGVHINRREPPKLGSMGPHPPWGARVAYHVKTSPLHICVTASNLLVLRQRAHAEIERTPKIGEHWGPVPCGRGVAVADP